MIRSIALVGLKVPAADVGLGPCNLLIGPVGSGKSAILDGIQFAALGCVPRVGRSEAATAALMNGDRIDVRVALDGDRAFRRSLDRNGRKLQGGADTTWLPAQTTLTGHADAIRALFGLSDIEAAENLDVVRLLSVSAAELGKKIEALLASGERSAGEVLARVRALWDARLDAGRELVDGLRKPLSPGILAARRETDEDLEAQVKGNEGNLVKAIEWAKVAKLGAADQARRCIAARAEIEARRIALKAPAEGRAQLEAARAQAKERITTLRTRLDLFLRVEEERATSAEQAQRAASAAAAASTALQTATQAALRAEALRAEADAIGDPPEIAAPLPSSPAAEAMDVAERLDREADELLAKIDALTHAMPAAVHVAVEESALTLAEERLRAAEASPWSRVQALVAEVGLAIDALVRAMAAAALETGSQEAWTAPLDELRALAADHGGDVVRLAAAVRDATDALAKARRAAAQVDAARASTSADIVALTNAAQGRRKAAQEARRVAQRVADDENAAAGQKYRDDRAARNNAVVQNEQRRRALRTQAAQLEAAKLAAEAAGAEATRRLTAAESRLAGLTDAVPLDPQATEAEIATIGKALVDLEPLIAACRDADALSDELGRLLRVIENATARRDVYAACEWAIQKLRDDDVVSRSSGLEAKIERFLAAAGRSEKPFIRNARAGVEIGWRSAGGEDVLVQAMSGGQAALFRAALGYALLVTRAPAIRILAIELAEACDGETEQAILRACHAVCDEVQVLAATCVPITVPEGCQVLRFGAEAVAEPHPLAAGEQA